MNTNPTSDFSENDLQLTTSSLPPADTHLEIEPRIIPVIEEQIQVDKQVVETGKLIITKTIHEEAQQVDLSLLQEEFSVERVPVNQYVDTPPAIRVEGDTTIYPVLKEVLVIEKKLVLVEEVRITKRQELTHESQQIILRKEEITVEHITSQPERPAWLIRPSL